MKEHHELQFQGVWVPDHICKKIKEGVITSMEALVWAFIATWGPVGWEYRTNKDTLVWVSTVLGLSINEVAGYVVSMQEKGIIQ